jgi:putative phosphoesterase
MKIQRVALIADIHANLPALEAVLQHCQMQGLTRFMNLGDHLGYGPFPEETIQEIQTLDGPIIIGNYDVKVLKVKKKANKWARKKDPLKLIAFQWARAQLSKESLNFLRSLPELHREQVAGMTFLLSHGSPAESDEPLVPETPEARLRELADLADCDVVLCGHSHVPFHRVVDRTHFINPGSIGRPDDGNPQASYAVLSVEGEHIEVKHHRVTYDIEQTLSALASAKLPASFARMFALGRSLDWVQQYDQNRSNHQE